MSELSKIFDEINTLTEFISQTTNPAMIKYFTDKIKELTAKAEALSVSQASSESNPPITQSNLSKHSPQKTAQRVQVTQQAEEIKAKMDEEAEDQEFKSQPLIPKSYTRYHLPPEIKDKVDKSVQSELSKLGDSRSIMHLTLE
jgi:hypothetical protein